MDRDLNDGGVGVESRCVQGARDQVEGGVLIIFVGRGKLDVALDDVGRKTGGEEVGGAEWFDGDGAGGRRDLDNGSVRQGELAAEAPTIIYFVAGQEALVGFGNGGVAFANADLAFAADRFRAAGLFNPDIGGSGGEHERGGLLGLVRTIFGEKSDGEHADKD